MSTTPKRAIVISSEGPMDIAAITLMGLSSKREDAEKIGMFGTGLKYSIAKLMRDGIAFRVWNGEQEITFEARKGNFRGTDYEQIIVNGEATSITTDMGPQWETWWIVRELLSNARDEQVHEFHTANWDEVKFTPGWTTFVLDYDAFEQVWLQREKFFLLDRLPKWERGVLKVYTRLGDGCRVYKNGVLVHEDEDEDAFDYDLGDVELNEMREPRYPTMIGETITEHLLRYLDDKDIAQAYLAALNNHLRYAKQTYTGSVGTYQRTTLTLSGMWKELVDTSTHQFHGKDTLNGDLPSDGIILPEGVHAVIQTHIRKDRPLEFTQPNAEQEAMIARVLGMMFDGHVQVRFPIRIGDLGPHTVGKAINGNIILHPFKAFDSDAILCAVLLEEMLHIVTGAGDMTRTFQNAIFNTWAGSIVDRGSMVNQFAKKPAPADDIDFTL